ncbi:sugar ABC transporter permease [Vibrio sp. SCSIO 43132]|uniref:carbohydrate ABC transporter permease n=1 Tax=Vibrio sp. SCSIO 43132 TaxID=2779363 RepID=UPI001CA8944C|nr:sugar ABC transporter permease [Vibrio sp. SCSIO 43132]UAB69199.1 sugar ABC transporter permease [Vibrio sp. SCSIO 43132]
MVSKSDDTRTALVFLLPSLVGMILFIFIPLVWSFFMGFTDWNLFQPPKWVGLNNFVNLFSSDPVFGTTVRNTLVFTVELVILNLVFSLAIAVWISAQTWGKAALRVIFFIPVFTPAIAVSIVWMLMLTPGGLFDSFISTLGLNVPNLLLDTDLAMHAVIIVSLWAGIGYNVVLFNAALELVPESYLEAARIDGAGAWRRFWDIRLPMISPTIFFAVTMTSINALQVFDQIYILTRGGPGASTMTLGYSIFLNGFQNYNMGYASAIAWVMFFFILALTVLQFKMQKKWVHYDG